VNPDFDYNLVEANGRKFVIAQVMLDRVSNEIGWEDVKVIQTVKGSQMEYMSAQHPFYDRTSLVMVGDHVTDEAGTGLVHTAPGHGEDDYFVAKKYDIDVLSPVDARGIFTAEAPGFEGQFYDKANPIITKMLEESGALLKLDFFTHSYPHDWRTKKPVIYRATAQWFASIDKFRQNILDEVEKVDWLVPWGKTRLYKMIENRGDWVISRQRAWGVPLPIFYAENGEEIITKETTEHVANLFADYGSIIWWEKEAKDLLPKGFTHEGSPNGLFTKESDIMDVWFDSGSSHEAVLRGRSDLTFPADLYLEGSDQYRGWFNSSITTSVAINGISPYKAVLSQGFVLDGEGRKMSKSLGNTILPSTVIKQYGADILRLWVTSVDTEADVRVSMDILGQVAEVYRKIRNTVRFLIANTSDFDPIVDKVAVEELPVVDKYMLARLHQLIKDVRENGYDKYDFIYIYKTIVNFLTVDLSQFYLDFAKDIVYITGANDHARRSMQTVFYETAVALTKLLSPILPFTTEEIWSELKETQEFVQLAEFPQAQDFEEQEEMFELWSSFLTFRDDVLKGLEEARNEKVIGKSLEAKLTVQVTPEQKAMLEALNTDIATILIVSDFEATTETIEGAKQFGETILKVERAQGVVCVRCRAVRTDVGSHAHEHPSLAEVCGSCATILEENFMEAVVEGFE
ncbi:MAG: isoleucine--tRNA ligase, partial [Streptococcaceae bacterium]|nr:isoleucine--tRNA ligase [Streptococcaceae bacterium]